MINSEINSCLTESDSKSQPKRNLLPTLAASEFLTEYVGTPTAPSTLETLRCRGGGPEYEYFGRRVLYRPEKLIEWALSRLSSPVTNTSQARVAA